MALFLDLPRAARTHGLGVVVIVLAVVAAGGVVTLAAGSADPSRNLAVALVLGVLLGAGYAVAQVGRGQQSRLSGPEEIEQRYGVPVFAVAASERLAHGAGRRFGSAASYHVDPDALVSEDFRRIRADLVARTDAAVGVLVVTSLRPGDGTSTVALGLAATAAASGQQVVLVDADLRRPGVARSLGLIEEVGLSDVLVGRVDVEDVLQPTLVDRLQVLAAGSVMSDPTGLVGSDAMRSVLNHLARTTFVVVDCPAMTDTVDATAVGALGDGVLLVVSAVRATDPKLEGALAQVGAAGGRTLGVIINRVGPDRSVSSAAASPGLPRR